MITVVTEKPVRSIEIKGYGVDSYVDKNGKKIYRVYGIVSPSFRGRLVSRDSEVVKDLYGEETTIVIYRNEDENLCCVCKGMIDGHVARGIPVFSVEQFKEWLKEQQDGQVQEAVTVNEN